MLPEQTKKQHIMKNRKAIIILSSAVVIAAVGFIVSPLVDWKVDSENASGDIGKTSRFSRKTSGESLSNMEELMRNDEAYKNSIVASYYVMQTRANQFASLVDMSNEVASDIPEYAGVLEDMNKAYVTVNNVCASLARSGADINTALGGESCPELAQNTINASLAYVALQKQNELANRFIDITDKYAAANKCEDRLLFVRDQWVDYQRMTAALDGDEKAAGKLEDKGYLLDSQKSVSTLGSFNACEQMAVLNSANVARVFYMNTQVNEAIPAAELRAAVDANMIFANNLQENVQENVLGLAVVANAEKFLPPMMNANNLEGITSEALSRSLALANQNMVQGVFESSSAALAARPKIINSNVMTVSGMIFSQVNSVIEGTSLGEVCKMVVW